jgi:DNA helicase-2/ATP-dependent DNA helicase PcrA
VTVKKSKPVPTVETPPAAATDPLLADLNAAQQQAVVHGDGPLLIVAGAGTGKTMVISRRIAWLVQTARAKPEEILALTFTDKAAGEMVERVDALLPLGYTDLWISTFHAFCQRILHEHALEIGLPDDFRLLNETDAYLLVRRNLDKFDLDYYRPLGNPAKFIHALLGHFSRAKDEAVSPEEYLEFVKNAALDQDVATEAEERSRLAEIANAYHVYQKLLLDNGCLDFGDLLLYTLRLFKTRRRLLDKYRAQFKQIIVDEFQDTNWAQYELLKLLVPQDGNIVVVGDDDQAIYKFRGASVANILQFKDDFPDAAEILLTQNYRSRQNILDRAHDFIKQNDPNRLEVRLGAAASKRLLANRPGVAPIEHLHFATAEDEVAGVADRITEIKNGLQDGQWSDFCILARSNSSADAFSYELQRRGIPYQFLALKGLYAKPVVLDCLAYFKLLDNYHESPALYRVLSSPPYRIDGEDLVNLTHQARRKAESLYETLKKQELLRLKPETSRTIDRLLGQLATHSQLAGRKNVSEMLVRFLYDSGYAAELKRDDTAEARERSSHLNQFLSRLRRFEAGHDEPTLRHFMEEFAIERDSGDEGSLSFDVETGPDMVRLMTVHAAKGLEFPYVFVVNLVDKRFPSIERGGGIELPDALAKEKIPEGDMHLEEERRLFYVAMTRAKDGLFFTSAEDYGGKTKKKPSRFIAELGFEPTSAAAPSVETLPDLPAAKGPSAAPKLAPPNYFSFTQLAAYAKCPLQYKYAHVLKLPLFGKGHFSFGKTIHSTLQKFMEEYADRRGMGQQQLFGAAAAADQDAVPVSREELEKMYEAAWIDDWYPTAQIKDSYRKKGRAILDSFYRRVTELHPEPLFLEKDFKVRLGSYWVRGKIDRIDKLPGGEVEIIDYKTGQSKGETKVKAEDKRQLMLYQIAAGRLLGLKPGRLTYEYLEDGTKVSFLAKDDELVAFEEGVSAEIDRIRGGDYTPTPGRHCDFCDFADICEFRG